MTTLMVVGDVVLDRDLLGHAERLCPDAPVPVVDEEHTVERAGGAGLAAVLAARAGARVTLVCALAQDEAARTLRRLLDREGVSVIDCGDGGSTTEKVRVRASGQSLLRIDRGTGAQLGDLPSRALDELGAVDAVLVADYGHGMAAHPAARDLVERVRLLGRPVVWDPHPRGADPVPSATLVTPNRDEAARLDPGPDRAAGGDEIDQTLTRTVATARRLRRHWHAGAVAVTLGESGALVVTGDGAPLVVPVDRPVQGADPCGAGDSFAAAVAVSLGSGALLSDSVQSGVDAAAAFVTTGGATRLAVPRPPTSLVATGGCFDVLHAGHVATLRHARGLGDRLVVLLNSDDSVRRLKGPSRPVQSQEDRAAVLRSLECVDEVVVFDDDTPEAALRHLRPDIFVKGGDYSSTDLPETAVMGEWGGTVVTVPFLAGRSTTQILRRVRGNGVTHVG